MMKWKQHVYCFWFSWVNEYFIFSVGLKRVQHWDDWLHHTLMYFFQIFLSTSINHIGNHSQLHSQLYFWYTYSFWGTTICSSSVLCCFGLKHRSFITVLKSSQCINHYTRKSTFFCISSLGAGECFLVSSRSIIQLKKTLYLTNLSKTGSKT